MKRFLGILLALILVVPVLGFRGEAATYGSCGEHLTWRFEQDTGTLIISGSGGMYDYTESSDVDVFSTAPWRSLPIKIVKVGENVTSLSGHVFENQDELVEVSLPESLKVMPSYAFASCNSLRSIKLPESMYHFNFSAFEYCTSLESIDLSNVTYITDGAFHGCTSLSEVILPETMEGLGRDVFSGCTSLTEITIPGGLTDISSRAFKGTSLRTVTIPEGVTRINSSAFSDMPYLHTVHLPLSLKSIDSFAFDNCPSLRDVHYPGTGEQMDNISISYNNDPLKNATWHFIGLDAPQIAIREASQAGVTLTWEPVEGAEYYEVWHSAAKPSLLGTFTYSSLGTTTGTEFTHLEPTAAMKNRYRVRAYDQETDSWSAYSNVPVWFYQIQRPTDNVCGDDLTWTFDESTGLLTISGTGEMYDWLTIDENSKTVCFSPWGELPFTAVRFEGAITGIGEGAFMECRSLQSVVIPDTVTRIGKCAFKGCTALTEAAFPASVTEFDTTSAFENCSALKTVVLPEGITGIGAYAFSGCENLTDFAIPATVQTLGGSAFLGCKQFTFVEIPDGVTSIPMYCFRGCTALEWVRIPVSVTSVGGSAFYACDSLLDVYYSGNKAQKANMTINSQNLELENAIWHYTFAGNLPAPEVTLTNTSYGGFKLAWERQGDSKYEISVATAPEGPYTVLSSSANSVYYKNNLECGIKYYFRVRALGTDIAGPSGYSNIVSGYSRLVMGRPTLTLPCSGETILRWKQVEGAMGYEIWRGKTGTKDLVVVGQTAELTFEDTSADRNVSYYYYVIALHGNPESNSEFSPIVYAYTSNRTEHEFGEWSLTKEPSVYAYGENSRTCALCGTVETEKIEALDLVAPVVKASSNASTGKPRLSWKAVEGASLYRIYRAVGSTGSYSYLKSTRGTEFTDTSAKAGTNYYYKVKAKNEDTEKISPFSNRVNRCCDLKRPVVTLKVDTASGKPKITFDKISGAEKYYIVRATSREGTYSKVATITGTTYIDRTAKAGTNYYYKVKALHAKDAADSAYSEITNRVCDLAKPVVSITRSNGDPRVKWETVSGAVKYEVYRATSKSGTYSKVYTAKTARSYTDTNAKAGKTYYYKVKAIHTNSAANSAFSPVKYITAK